MGNILTNHIFYYIVVTTIDGKTTSLGFEYKKGVQVK